MPAPLPGTALRLEIKEISDAGEFEGFLSTYGNEDLGGDIMVRGAFKASIKARAGKVRLLSDHDTTHRAGTLYLTDLPEGLYVRAVLNLASPIGQQAYSEVKFYQEHGPPMELSVGYKTKKDRWEQNRRYVQEADLWEGSLVCFAMNPQAFVTSVKAQEIGMLEGETHPETSTAAEGTRSPATPETKQATPFERIYRYMMLWEARYRMADALWASVSTILEDGNLDDAAQNTAAEESLGQFGREVLAWMAEYRVAYSSVTTLGAQLALEHKGSQGLSARTRQLLVSATEALNALLTAGGGTPEAASEDEGTTTASAPTLAVESGGLEDLDPVALTELMGEMQSFLGGRNH